jgi:multiple sugar transport system permease protein
MAVPGGLTVSRATTRRRRSGVYQGWLGPLCLVPTIVVLVAVLGYPMLYSFWMSLQSYDLIAPPVFRGLQNYGDVLRSDLFWNALKVSLTFTVGAFVVEFVLGLGLALLIERDDVRFKSVFRVLFITPLLITPVVIGLNWRVMLNRDYGIINYVLGLFGVPRIDWAISSATAMPTLIAVDAWHTTSFVMLVMAAGLVSLPAEVFEAAEIDGANGWQQLRYVTLPLLRPLILVISLWRSLALIQMFDIAYTLTEGGPGRLTQTLSLYDYNLMFSGYQVGKASAASYLIFLICLAVGLLLIKVMGLRGSDEGNS